MCYHCYDMARTMGSQPASLAGEEAKILIVDAETGTCEKLMETLSRNGFRAVAVRGREGTLFEFGMLLADLVILDVPRHGEDRWGVLRRLREYTTVPIIALTSAADPGAEFESLGLGAGYAMAKPVAIRESEARVRALIRRTMIVAGSGHAPQSRQDQHRRPCRGTAGARESRGLIH